MDDRSTRTGLAALGAVLLCAAAGQAFLARSADPASLPWGLAFFALAFLAAVRAFPGKGGEGGSLPALPPPLEASALLLLFALAVFLRTYRLDSFPSGLCSDESRIGLGGLAILDGWRPFFETQLEPLPSPILYGAAAWFRFLEPNGVNLHLYFTALSLTALPLAYLCFRRLAGMGPALLTVFFLAVARWDVYYCRWGHSTLLTTIFLFGALLFWLRGLSGRSTRDHLLAGLCLGLGLYGYYSFRVVPFLFLVWMAYEVLREKGRWRRDASGWSAGAAVFLAVSLPLFSHWLGQPDLGQGYPVSNSLWETVRAGHSLGPLASNFRDWILMLNRKGDSFSMHNFASHRMLDDVVGAIWVLGLFQALRRLGRREYFYPVSAILVLGLNGILTQDPASANRSLSMLPFVLFLASCFLWEVVLKLARSGVPAVWTLLAVGLLLAASGAQNFRQLFVLQASDHAVWRVFDPGPTWLGTDIAGRGGDYDYLVTPRLGAHYTTRFLAYRRQADYRAWDWPGMLAFTRPSPGKKGVCFVMAEGQEGVLKLLESLYPGGKTEVVRDLDGIPQLYCLRVSREGLAGNSGLAVRGWSRPADPENLPPGPFRESLEGSLFLEKSGKYAFGSEPAGEASLELDGPPLAPGKVGTWDGGFHSIRVRYRTRNASKVRLWGEGPEGKRFILGPACLTPFRLARGLREECFTGGGMDRPAGSRRDPLVNFTYRTELMFWVPPLRIRWEGALLAPEAGRYEIMVLTEPTDRVSFRLDGVEAAASGPSPTRVVEWGKGSHPVELDFRMGGGFFSAISLAWKRPGENRFEIVPTECLSPP